jgi:CDP-diacylglycerol--glycerol-3-phosphate 3-phosphatidyltransferase
LVWNAPDITCFTDQSSRTYPSDVAEERTVSGPLTQLPNALTVARLVVIPIYATLILGSHAGFSWLAGVIFGLAGVTDQIDGFLARRWHVESAFGKIADPLADRLLIDVAVILLWHAGRLPWAAFAIPARDVFVIAATPLVLRRGYRFEVNALGKLATWLFYASLGLVMVVHHGAWPLWIFWAGFGLAVVSLALYARKARKEITVARGTEHSQVEVDG